MYVQLIGLYILVMVAAIYRGLLTSHLNFPDMTPTIDRLDDLVQATSRRTMSWGLMGGTSQHSLFKVLWTIIFSVDSKDYMNEHSPLFAYRLSTTVQKNKLFTISLGFIFKSCFKNSESGIYHTLWQSLISSGNADRYVVKSYEQGAQLVSSTNFAFMYNTVIHKTYMAENGVERFHLSKDGLLTNFYGVVLGKGSPLQPVFDQRYVPLFPSILRAWHAIEPHAAHCSQYVLFLFFFIQVQSLIQLSYMSNKRHFVHLTNFVGSINC